jgi:hypothetical protein
MRVLVVSNEFTHPVLGHQAKGKVIKNPDLVAMLLTEGDHDQHYVQADHPDEPERAVKGAKAAE